MANGRLVVLVAATLVLLLSAGNVDAQVRWTQEQVVTFYFPAPATIIAGPGTGSTNESKAAFGSLSVFDVFIQEGRDNTSKSLGTARGTFLVDSHDGANLLNLYTITFTSDAPNGSVVIAGDFNAGQPTSVQPIIGGTGEFSGAEGYLLIHGPEAPTTPGQVFSTTAFCELHFRLRKYPGTYLNTGD